MLVSCLYPSGQRIKLDIGRDNFLLPLPSTLEIEDINGPLYVDGQISDSSSIPYSGENKVIECCGEKCTLIALKDTTPENLIIEYHQFTNTLRNQYFDGSIVERTLFAALSETDANFGINLCTFNRQIESAKHDTKLDEAYKKVGVLPIIFSKPRLHLRSISEVKPVDNVTRIGHEAIKHLASHSEHWEARTANGLIPARLLAKTLEDEYCIYENIAAKCLIDKIWQYMLGLRENLKNIRMQIPSEEGFMSVSAEHKLFFQAREILLKGYSSQDIQLVNSLVEKEINQVDYILNKLSECKDTVLYRELRRCKPIFGPLKPTNIFMMDNNYKRIFELWQVFTEIESSTTNIDTNEITKDITADYQTFCQTMLVFALKHFNFENIQGNQATLFKNDLFQGGQFEFKDWNLSVKSVELSNLRTKGIAVSVSMKINHVISTRGIVLPDIEDFSGFDFLYPKGEDLVFRNKPGDDEIDQFCSLVRKKANGDRGRAQRLYSELKKRIVDSFIGFTDKESTILFIPISFKFADSSVVMQKCIEGMDQQISEFIIDNNINAYYYLSPFRPTDYSQKETYNQLSPLLNYGYANSCLNEKHIYKGVLPITISDMNSYRRFSKAILIQMLEADDRHKYCPICGDISNAKENSFYCRTCEMEIFSTICNKCQKFFKFTKYKIPKMNTVIGDTVNLKILIKESSEGFKNITDIDNNGHPICPYCGCPQ